MYLFLAGAIPFSYGMILSFFYPGESTFQNSGKPFLKGIAILALSFLVYWPFSSLVILRFSAGGIYLYYFFHQGIFFIGTGILGFFLVHRYQLDSRGSDTALQTLSFFSGFFLLLSIVDIIRFQKELTGYLLFTLPLIRISLVLGISAILTLAISVFGVLRYLLIFAVSFLASIAALVPTLFLLSFYASSYLLAIVLVFLTGLLFLIVRRRIR